MKVDRYVVDTNVLISASLLANSPPAQVLQHVLKHARLVFSTATFSELETRLWRPKFDRYLSIEDRKWLLRDLQGVADWVEPTARGAARCRDPADEKFIQLAVAGDAKALISGDKDLLILKALDGIPVLTPAAALRQWARDARD
jgi:uncharacterized protein